MFPTAIFIASVSDKSSSLYIPLTRKVRATAFSHGSRKKFAVKGRYSSNLSHDISE